MLKKNRYKNLSPQEKKVLEHISNGLSDKEIAKIMGISYRTVNGYVTRINMKFNTTNRAHSVFFAIKNKIIS